MAKHTWIKSILIALFSLIVFCGAYILYIDSYRGEEKTSIILDSTSQSYSNLTEILAKPDLRNRIVYVDIWGTRCGPCIMEFPHSKKLSAHYAENHDIVFLYLCSPYGKIDDELRWKHYIDKFELRGHHILMTESCYFNVYNEVDPSAKIYTIPRYLIIQNGKIINSNAPPPSQYEDLILILDKLLTSSRR